MWHFVWSLKIRKTVDVDVSHMERQQTNLFSQIGENWLVQSSTQHGKNRWNNSHGLCGTLYKDKDCYYTMLSLKLKWIKLPTKLKSKQDINPTVLHSVITTLSFPCRYKDLLLIILVGRCRTMLRTSTSFVMGTRTCKHSMTHMCGIGSLLQISMDSQAAAATVLLCSLFPEKRRDACSRHHRSSKSPGSFLLYCDLVVIHRASYSQPSISLHTGANKSILSLGLHPRFPTWCLAPGLPAFPSPVYPPCGIVKAHFVLCFGSKFINSSQCQLQWLSRSIFIKVTLDIYLKDRFRNASFALIQTEAVPSKNFLFLTNKCFALILLLGFQRAALQQSLALLRTIPKL